MPATPRSQRLVANRYQLTELVGSGAMGQVYRAEDKLLGGVTVAVKFLSQTLLNNKMRERFEREATISALLGEKSSHIVRVKDYGIDEKEIPFYVMEFLQGESLSDLIKFRPLPCARFLHLARQICFGIECAHKGIIFQGETCPIIHRDLKPSNILIIQDSALGELAKILDFGIAKLLLSDDSQTQSFMGTLAYCSPEQMEGKELDNRSDIYSLGVMMYEMVTTEMPLFPDNPSFGGWYEAHHYVQPKPFSSTLNLPPKLQDLIMRCLAKAPQDRPQNVSELLQALDAIDPNQSSHQGRLSNEESFKATVAADLDSETLLNQPFIPSARENKPLNPVRENPASPSAKESVSSIAAREICLKSYWPDDKPQQKIVFPNVIRTTNKTSASVWVMLEQQDIVRRLVGIRYNHFLFMPTPHPMVLWLTVLYHPEYGPRWLPCYLDLKTTAGQRLTRILGESGSYWILLFALETPKKCQQVLTSNIATSQCQLLKEWAITSQMMKGGKPQLTKSLLKQELEKLKPKMLTKLKALNPDRL